MWVSSSEKKIQMAISPWRCSTSPKWDVTSVCKAYEGVKKLLSKLPKVCAHYFTEGNLTVNIKKGLKQLYSICENLAKEETEGNNWTNVQRRSRAHTGEQMRWSLQAVEPVTTLPTEGIYFKPGSQSPADPSEDRYPQAHWTSALNSFNDDWQNPVLLGLHQFILEVGW